VDAEHRVTKVICTEKVVAETIDVLRRGGQRGEERVALWLAGAAPRSPARVIEVYEPDQVADVDYFRLPPDSMRALMQHLGFTRRRIVAQIHTHPGRAYHSKVDAEWAIVRHVGALSLVVPRFAKTTTVANFLRQTMTYEFSADAQWLWGPNNGPAGLVKVTP
jgi:proteasome lid subunit RPN8/RPN11